MSVGWGVERYRAQFEPTTSLKMDKEHVVVILIVITGSAREPSALWKRDSFGVRPYTAPFFLSPFEQVNVSE